MRMAGRSPFPSVFRTAVRSPHLRMAVRVPLAIAPPANIAFRGTTEGFPATRRQSVSGFTLIEVMIAMVLVAVLMTGLGSLWVQVNAHFDDVRLRQQAIFRLNGEMERLMGEIWIEGLDPDNDGADVITSGGYPADDSQPTRFIYNDPAIGPASTRDNVTTDVNIFRPAAPPNPDETAFDALDMVYFHDGIGTDDRNIVWLDYDRNIVATISWVFHAIGSGLEGNCTSPVGSPSCQVVELFLNYPYRFEDQNTPLAAIGDGTIETLVLRTIVGVQ